MLLNSLSWTGISFILLTVKLRRSSTIIEFYISLYCFIDNGMNYPRQFLFILFQSQTRFFFHKNKSPVNSVSFFFLPSIVYS